MKLRNPVYLGLAAGLVFYLLFSSHYGWSLFHSLAAKSAALRGPHTQHK